MYQVYNEAQKTVNTFNRNLSIRCNMSGLILEKNGKKIEYEICMKLGIEVTTLSTHTHFTVNSHKAHSTLNFHRNNQNISMVLVNDGEIISIFIIALFSGHFQYFFRFFFRSVVLFPFPFSVLCINVCIKLPFSRVSTDLIAFWFRVKWIWYFRLPIRRHFFLSLQIIQRLNHQMIHTNYFASAQWEIAYRSQFGVLNQSLVPSIAWSAFSLGLLRVGGEKLRKMEGKKC